MSNKGKVTLCMIAKNEEENITCCINSVTQLIDEIILVDTGSSDRTIEYAVSLGAKVFHYNWDYNFANARNYALEQATGEWILVLDADEVLEYDVVTFNNLLTNDQVDGYLIDIESYIRNGEDKTYDQVVRLFRNKPNYRFAGAVHEQVIGSIKASNHGEGLACTDLKIIHRGYLNKIIQAKNKHMRNMEVIKRALRANPDDAFLHYSLGIEYIQQAKVEQSIEHFTKALKHLTGSEGYFHSVVVNLASGLLQTGQFNKAEELLDKAIITQPQDSDLILLKGMAALYSADYKTAIKLLQQSLTGSKDNTLLSTIHTLCGDIYTKLKHYTQAELAYFTALQLVPQHMYPLLQLIGLKQQAKSQLSWQEISKFTLPAINKALQKSLQQMGEANIVLVLALLNLLNQTNTAFGDACNDYYQAIMLYQPKNKLSEVVHSYLKFSAKQLLLYTNINSPLLSEIQSTETIINNNLDLIITTLFSKPDN